MAGIYIHIPFCKTRCSYCDFYSTTNESVIIQYVDAVIKELKQRKDELFDQEIETIYFGGGTPSQLPASEFARIFSAIFEIYRVSSQPEITLEANPDDLTPQYISALLELPFNRISIGIQSFNDKDLLMLNRRHTADQAFIAVNECATQGFKNISIDLMYGLPSQTIEEWKYNLEETFKLPVQHVSAYHLTYESGTKLSALLAQQKISETAEESSIAMFEELRSAMEKNGFIHYEISNFAKEGFISRHNSAYWKGIHYLGIGASAHSYDGSTRSWNPANLTHYIRQIESGDLIRTIEQLTPQTQYNDLIITSLRTIWGLNLEQLRETLGPKFYDHCMETANSFIQKKWLLFRENTLIISKEGLFMADTIMSELLYVD